MFADQFVEAFNQQRPLGAGVDLSGLRQSVRWAVPVSRTRFDSGADAKATIEQTAGYWLIEVAELAGMDRRDIEAVKAQITTREDRARPAYGRLAVTVPRQFVMIGTTNDSTYLKDQTKTGDFRP